MSLQQLSAELLLKILVASGNIMLFFVSRTLQQRLPLLTSGERSVLADGIFTLYEANFRTVRSTRRWHVQYGRLAGQRFPRQTEYQQIHDKQYIAASTLITMFCGAFGQRQGFSVSDISEAVMAKFIAHPDAANMVVAGGTWTKTRGELFLRLRGWTYFNSMSRDKVKCKRSFRLGLLRALKEGCVPGVVALLGKTKEDWGRSCLDLRLRAVDHQGQDRLDTLIISRALRASRPVDAWNNLPAGLRTKYMMSTLYTHKQVILYCVRNYAQFPNLYRFTLTQLLSAVSARGINRHLLCFHDWEWSEVTGWEARYGWDLALHNLVLRIT